MTDWYKEALELQDELTAIRRDLHQHPELSNHEFRTSEIVENYLKDLGLEVKRITPTGITALIRGKSLTPCIALRADMDALPVEEKADVPWRSLNPGVMHACGHDIHTSSLLGAAKLLVNHKDELEGSVKLIFQPAEELDQGANAMVDAGVLEDPYVDAVFGCHDQPDLKAGIAGIRYGAFYAADDRFHVKVTGKSCHAALPQNGIDALNIAAKIAVAFKELPKQFKTTVVVTVGMFHAGTQDNILAGFAEMKGVVRTHDREERLRLLELLKTTADTIAKEDGGKAEVLLEGGCCSLINSDPETDLVYNTAVKTLGKENVVVLEEPTMVAEDFARYSLHRPVCFYQVGVECEYSLHSPYFNPNEKAITSAAAMHAASAYEYLLHKTR